jgi:hypothetical protein
MLRRQHLAKRCGTALPDKGDDMSVRFTANAKPMGQFSARSPKIQALCEFGTAHA